MAARSRRARRTETLTRPPPPHARSRPRGTRTLRAAAAARPRVCRGETRRRACRRSMAVERCTHTARRARAHSDAAHALTPSHPRRRARRAQWARHCGPRGHAHRRARRRVDCGARRAHVCAHWRSRGRSRLASALISRSHAVRPRSKLRTESRAYKRVYVSDTRRLQSLITTFDGHLSWRAGLASAANALGRKRARHRLCLRTAAPRAASLQILVLAASARWRPHERRGTHAPQGAPAGVPGSRALHFEARRGAACSVVGLCAATYRHAGHARWDAYKLSIYRAGLR